MTISNFGQITPLQGDMLYLAGYGPVVSGGERSLERPEEPGLRVANIRAGRRALVKATGHDYGHSLQDWHNALITDPTFSRSYSFARAWRFVEKAIRRELTAPDRELDEALADLPSDDTKT